MPCFNEEAAIAKVVGDFRAALPEATIYVYDNNSTDRTIEVARAAGAVVRRETHQGKGNVVRRMFADVDADIYVLVDGDATYHAPSARAMVARLIEDRLDMVVAARVDGGGRLPSRPPAGNRLLTAFFACGFRRDVHRHSVRLPRVLAALRQVVPGAVEGFEIETELDRPCARARAAGGRDATPYYARPGRIGVEAQHLARWLAHPGHDRQALPLGAAAGFLLRCIGIVLATSSIVLAIPIFVTYFEEGVVPRIPTAILSTGLMLLAFLSIVAGLVLDTVTAGGGK